MSPPLVSLLFALLVLLFLVPAAHAGIADSPAPNLTGASRNTTKVIYSVTGVYNNAGLGTYFSCTNVSTSTITLGVEVFGPVGGGPVNNALTTAATLGAGATVLYGTSTPVGITPDANLGLGTIVTGSARSVATSKALVCDAFVAERLNAPPTTMLHLTIVAKTKQKGE